ncbi:iron chelate uptake ABC transporter family permease subunit [Anaerocolumna sp. AGMB13025]|uniref:FecCD family ABC transporter permease n=1 Tax=Anaerocolumna sp. AGMB13025 TaxID=3039116 RepID=UPI00241C27C4|nr:iron chelate uptake ABC transporter family permease subunit [Anaerocolumna sp. AGMB13025]WFR55685.1 iron chelate uptake ABC transporter family permease subunit [Anaerocolumna sp. AGMB13025]
MKYTKRITVLIISLISLVLCILASLAFGARYISIQEVLNALLTANADSINALVVRERIPRTVFGIIAGASLGVSGVLMQAITRNPIADPSILGVNTGASLFVVSGIAFFHINTAGQYIWFALAGAALTAVFVYGIGSMGSGGATPIKLALAGAATSAALSSLVSAIILPRTEVMNAYRFWQVGSISGATWEGITKVLPLLLIGLLIGILSAPALNALALGDDVATGLGVNTGIIRITGALAGVLLCGAVTALAGPIGFVGLMVPHIMRLLWGPDLRLMIPMSAIGGAIILTISDVIGRLIGTPGELEAGIVTAFLGAPILISIAMRAKVRSL